MDSLRITLLLIGIVLIVLIYAWGRIKRSKEETRYARWGGVAEEGTEAHIVGRNSGDLETDAKLVESAYDGYVADEISTELDADIADKIVIDPQDNWQGADSGYDGSVADELSTELDADIADKIVIDPQDNWQQTDTGNVNSITDELSTELDAGIADKIVIDPQDNWQQTDTGNVNSITDELSTELDAGIADKIVIDPQDNWQTEVEISLADEPVETSRLFLQDDEDLDLDSDPEDSVNPIDEITSELEALEEMISADSDSVQIDLGDIDIPLTDTDTTSSEPDRVIVVHVLAKTGSVFSGADILHCVTHLGLQYGEMNVFHCVGNNNKSIFSLVNAVEPGIFDLSDMDNMTTPALLLMMSLPNPVPALEVFDGMLEAARSLTSSLDGRLCDETRSVLTRQAIDETRAELAAL